MSPTSPLKPSRPTEWNAKQVYFFMNNGRLVIMLIILLLIGGIYSFKQLRREGFPAVTVKILRVQTIYPGASAEQVESQVSNVIEKAVADAQSVEEVSSSSSNNISNVIITLNSKADLDRSLDDIRNRVIAKESDLPKEAQKPEVLKVSASNSPFTLGLWTNQAPLDLKTSQAFVEQLSGVDGVKAVEPQYDYTKKIVVKVSLEKFSRLNISLDTLSTIIKANSIDIPLNQVEINDKDQSLTFRSKLNSIEDLKNTLIIQTAGSTTRLKDIAQVTLEPVKDDFSTITGVQDNNTLKPVEAIIYNIDIKSNADLITVKENIDIKISQLKAKQEFELINPTFLYDESKNTQEQIDEIVAGAFGEPRNLYLLGGVQLVIIVMLLFVNLRAALISALVIPFGMLFTFIVLNLFGINLNTIVLFSLILLLGLLVDPAIVILEAIQRARDLGYSPKESVIRSANLYGASIFIAVLTSLIVFAPFGVIGGTFGDIIKYIPITVIAGLLSSYLIPIWILPKLAQLILRKNPKADLPNSDTKYSDEEERGLWKAAHGVMGLNRWILAKLWRKALVIAVTILLTAASLSLILTQKVPSVQFSQPKDNLAMLISVQYPNGLTKEGKTAINTSVEQSITQTKRVNNFYYNSQSPNSSSLFITLKPFTKGDRVSSEVIKDLNRNLETINGAEVIAKELSSGPPSANYQVQMRIYGQTFENLKGGAADIEQYLRSQKEVSGVINGYNQNLTSEIKVSPNDRFSSLTTLSKAEFALQLKGLLDETQLGKISAESSQDNDASIYLTTDVAKTSIDSIKNIIVASRDGKRVKVKVSDIATVQQVDTLGTINRTDSKRYVLLQARVDNPNDISKISTNLNTYISDNKLKQLGLQGKNDKGEFSDIAESFSQLGIAFILAIFLSYFVMALQFKSFSLPLVMLLTIPPALIGVFPALYLIQGQFGFLEFLGLTILIGIVENVAIFLIDYANKKIDEGFSPQEAIILASGVRFRSIILTKLVALGGLLPLAIESEFWRGLSLVIIAGIGVSGFFSMVIIPIFYVFVQNLRMKRKNVMITASK